MTYSQITDDVAWDWIVWGMYAFIGAVVALAGLLAVEIAGRERPTPAQRASRLVRLGDAISQALNVVLFNGDSNHSISGDAYRYGREPLRQWIDAAFSPFERDHCRMAYENDVAKARELINEVLESAR